MRLVGWHRCWSVVLAALIVFGTPLVIAAAHTPAGPHRLEAVADLDIAEPFLGYWRDHGGLARFGYPLSPLMRETSRADGREYAVQYFERARFEHHPEYAGQAAVVLLGQLGRESIVGRRSVVAAPVSALADRRFFAETGHNLGGSFLAYWEVQGALAQFGYPLTEEFTETLEDGRPYVVQYFERARFEHHPENAAPYDVLLGQLGRRALVEAQRARSGFVDVQGDQFVAGPDRHPAKLKGINYYPRDHPWAIWREWDLAQVRFELDRAVELGVNSLRVFVSVADFGGSERDWRDQRPFIEFLDLCRERNIRVIVGLFDSHRKWPQPGWDAWPAAGSVEEARDFAFLRAILGPRSEDPTILAYDLYNEPDWVSYEEWSWRDHAPNRVAWLSRMVAYARMLAPRHLLTVGTITPLSLLMPEGRALANTLDFLCIHYYRRNAGGQRLEHALGELVPLDRPILVEEAGHEGDGLHGQTEDDQADYLREVIVDLRQRDGAGFLIWTLNDFPPRFGYGVEGTYGLLRTDYTLKPIAIVFRDEIGGERWQARR